MENTDEHHSDPARDSVFLTMLAVFRGAFNNGIQGTEWCDRELSALLQSERESFDSVLLRRLIHVEPEFSIDHPRIQYIYITSLGAHSPLLALAAGDLTNEYGESWMGWRPTPGHL